VNTYRAINPMREKIVFFEGLDKSGKSLLCRKARFASGHEVLMFDRGFVGRDVFYDFRKEFEFPIRDWHALRDKLILLQAIGIVYLDVPAKIPYNRQLAAGEKPEFTVEDLELQRSLYHKGVMAMMERGVPVLHLQNHEETEETALKKILNWIKGEPAWKSAMI
jgi:thymidylate kinase